VKGDKEEMGKVDADLLQFFEANYSPGSIGLVGAKDEIGLAIRESQSALTTDKKASLWSHCFIMGDERLDRRGPGKTFTKSPYIFESDLKVNLFRPQIRNGAQENWIGKWCNEHVEHAAIIDFGLSAQERDNILATALQLVDEQALYPIQELLGTWWVIVVNRQWLPNPLDDPHAMYCSAFVRHCYKRAGRNFLDNSASISNTTPEDIARSGLKEKAIKIYK
jgi:hypothetical protein